jgi:hypothetical protein
MRGETRSKESQDGVWLYFLKTPLVFPAFLSTKGTGSVSPERQITLSRRWPTDDTHSAIPLPKCTQKARISVILSTIRIFEHQSSDHFPLNCTGSM